MPAPEDVIGVSGHFISAVLETAGLYGLSTILAQLEPLILSFGFLIYIIAAISALYMYVVYGRAQTAIVLLICPVLFYQATFDLVSVKHANVQYGDRVPADLDDDIQEAVKSMFDSVDFNQGAKVPRLFGVYDRMVSQVVQTIVGFLLDTQNNVDIIAAARDRAMSRLLLADNEEQEFLWLLSTSLMGDCAKGLGLIKDLSDPRLINAAPGSPDEAERTQKLALYDQFKIKTQPIDNHVSLYIERLGFPPTNSATCEKIWEYTAAACLATGAQRLNIPPSITGDYDLTTQQWQEVYDQLRMKLLPSTATPANMNEAFRIVAAIILRNTMFNTAHGAFTAEMAGRQEWLIPSKSLTSDEKLNSFVDETRTGLAAFAGSVPYVQGLLLYLLAIGFPFFSVFLLLPGRMGSIFTWFALWAWVKSWDIGFALVFQLREILWEMLGHPGDVEGLTMNATLDWSNPSSVFTVIYQNDPTMSLTLYMGAVSIATLGVPVVMAYLFQGASEIMGIARRGLKMGGR